MADRSVDANWFKDAIKAAGYGSAAKFVPHAGLSTAKFSLIINGKRRAQMSEVKAMSDALRVPAAEVLAALGIQYDNWMDHYKKIVGFVGAADAVVLYEEDDPDYGLEEITVPFIAYAGSCLRVRGGSMVPRYLPGEIIGATIFERRGVSPLRLLGEDVVVRLRDGRMLLKRLQRGSDRNRFTLLSINPEVEPILDAEAEWIVPVDFHLPGKGS